MYTSDGGGFNGERERAVTLWRKWTPCDDGVRDGLGKFITKNSEEGRGDTEEGNEDGVRTHSACNKSVYESNWKK